MMKKFIILAGFLAIALFVNIISVSAQSSEPESNGGNDTVNNSSNEPGFSGGHDTVDNDSDEPEFSGGHDTVDNPSNDDDSDNDDSSNNNGGSQRHRRSSGGSASVPSEAAVLGAAIGPNGQVLSCAPHLVTFMKLGWENDPAEVRKLQSFLNEYTNANLPMTGFFGQQTFEAVKVLQGKYSEEILRPWDLAGLSTNLQPTGFVYKMTQWFVNSRYCDSIPKPVLI